MISENDLIKMIFGFKLKHLRQEHDLSLEELAERTGISKSYLQEIEKGKKYPKIDKINMLAGALKTPYDYLVSTHGSGKLEPVFELLTSDFMKDFPLEHFGIQPEKLFELFSNTPDKINAFISTIVKITRNYQVQREHLYLAALRSYQEMHQNYFEELEKAVRDFREEAKISEPLPYSTAFLESLLKERYSIRVDRQTLPKYRDLNSIRSFFSEAESVLYINKGLSSAQENFLLGRELAFQHLGLAERTYLTRIVAADSFEHLLNNFRASYFSIALLVDENELAEDIRRLAGGEKWAPASFLDLLAKYDVTPEMLLQRMTNILPRHFGIRNLFFIRLAGDKDLKQYRMTKELHLSRLHNPYANELNEHYCRRWVSVNIIKKARAQLHLHGGGATIADAQISQYWETPNQYLCISIARPDTADPANTVSVTVGLLIDDKLRSVFRFLADPELPARQVNTTCERCNIPNCEARAAPPVALEEVNRVERIRNAIDDLMKNQTRISKD